MKQIFFLLFLLFVSRMLVAQDCDGISGDITPASSTICQGNSVLLTATGGSSYEWSLNGVVIDGQTGSTLTATAEGTYSVIIKEGECSVPASNTATVTVNPTPTGTITPATTSICAGGSTVLTATGGDSYTWFLNGTEIPGENNATIQVNQAGTYSAVIHQGDCSADASNTAVVTSASAPTGNINPATATICPGGSTTLTATGGTSYTWFRNGNEIEGETGATITVSQQGTYSVVIHQGDCSGEASNTAEVTRTSNPTGTISPANASICQGGSVVLTATGGDSYTWFRNGNEIAGQTGETITVTQGGTYSVVVHVGDCSGQASNNSVVTVSNNPTGSISPAVGSICPGGSIILTASGGTTYTWFLNGVEIEGETGAELAASQAGTYSATIHQGTCSGTASNTSIITLTPTPVGSISPAAGSICEGGTITLTATGGTSYTWFRNGVEIANETAATLDVTQPGTYFAIIRQGTCSGPALNTSIITQSPAPTGTISPATASICSGSSTVLTATGGTSYVWFRNGTQISGQTGATLTVTQEGTYTATIKQGTCSGPASNSAVVEVASAPTGAITPAEASFCEGGSVTLTITGGTSYIWYRNNIAMLGETGATLTTSLPGTYTATIKQGNCSGTSSNSAVVSVGTKPTGDITPATASLCGGGSVTLTATGGTSYTWMRDDVVIDGATSATLNVTEAGTYSVIIKNGTCEGPAGNTAVVTAENDAGTRYPNVNARVGVAVQLEARDIGVSYEWTPPTDLSGTTSRTPTVTTSQDREYTVKITTASGCLVTDTVLVKVTSTIFIPTAFTPNKNGKNDVLRPLGELQRIESFRVYNRWGQMMFQTSQPGAGWDGKFKGADQPSDTYTWILVGVGQDGRPVKLSGKTLLIR